MEKLSAYFENLKLWYQKPRTKKRLYVLLVVVVVLWVIYRFWAISTERRMVIFNPARQAADTGLVVDVLPVQKTTGILREPLSVKNNRANVSASRVHLFKAGQKVGAGKIVSVSDRLDLDTGMYLVTTRGAADGLNFVEYSATGYFVPTDAVYGNVVYVVNDGVAMARNVNISRSDSENTVITDGLLDGDIVILSRVTDGNKVQIKE